MKNLQAVADKAAIGMSLVCAIHCLILPVAVVLLPSFSALPLNNEAFHLWLVAVVVPTSVYALTMGCKTHKRFRVMVLGSVGLGILVVTAIAGEAVLGALLEKTFTLVGAGVIALGHFWNFRLCRDRSPCACS